MVEVEKEEEEKVHMVLMEVPMEVPMVEMVVLTTFNTSSKPVKAMSRVTVEA